MEGITTLSIPPLINGIVYETVANNISVHNYKSCVESLGL